MKEKLPRKKEIENEESVPFDKVAKRLLETPPRPREKKKKGKR
ncbi:MAG: hypothetical protein RX318_06625 [bacterium]|nr:hypothetical protein [bacterium]